MDPTDTFGRVRASTLATKEWTLLWTQPIIV